MHEREMRVGPQTGFHIMGDTDRNRDLVRIWWSASR